MNRQVIKGSFVNEGLEFTIQDPRIMKSLLNRLLPVFGFEVARKELARFSGFSLKSQILIIFLIK